MYDIKRDYDAFLKDLPSLMEDHNSEVVVYHNGQRDDALGTFATISEALDAGIKAHGDGNFIAQSVVPQTPVAMAAFL